PIGADAHGLAVRQRHLDDGAELTVLFLLEPDIAGIDAVLVERLGAGRMLGEQLVADIMEITDDGRGHAHLEEPLLDVGDRRRRLVAIDGDAHELRARPRQRRYLADRRLDIGGVGVGHRLHHHRGTAADGHVPHLDRGRLVPRQGDVVHRGLLEIPGDLRRSRRIARAYLGRISAMLTPDDLSTPAPPARRERTVFAPKTRATPARGRNRLSFGPLPRLRVACGGGSKKAAQTCVAASTPAPTAMSTSLVSRSINPPTIAV